MQRGNNNCLSVTKVLKTISGTIKVIVSHLFFRQARNLSQIFRQFSGDMLLSNAFLRNDFSNYFFGCSCKCNRGNEIGFFEQQFY